MKLALRILLLALAFIPTDVFADDIIFTNLNATFGVAPNDGFGDNVYGVAWAPGVQFFMIGGTPLGWLDIEGQPAGTVWNPLGGTVLFVDGASLKIGTQSFDLTGGGFIETGSFTFPTNGKDFRIALPAFMGFGGTLVCPELPCPNVTLETLGGVLRLSFLYEPERGLYHPLVGSFTTTAEPSTMALMGIGLTAVSWAKYKIRPLRVALTVRRFEEVRS